MYVLIVPSSALITRISKNAMLDLDIADSKDYFAEGMRQLNDINCYQKLNCNPTEEHENLVNNTIDDLVSENAIDKKQHLFYATRNRSFTCSLAYIKKAPSGIFCFQTHRKNLCVCRRVP